MLTLTAKGSSINIDMRLGACDFQDALSQALDDFAYEAGKVTH